MRAALVVFTVVALAPLTSRGQGENPLKVVAPYINEQTFYVARDDVAQLDPDALAKRLQATGLGEDLEKLRFLAQLARGVLLKAGCREIFVVHNWEHGLDEPLIVVPLPRDANAQALSLLVRQALGYETMVADGTLLVGRKSLLERMKQFQAKPAPQLAKAFASAGPGAVQAAFVPPPYLKRALIEIFPNVPKELGGGKTAPLADAFQWLALSLDTGERLKLRVIVQADDARGAKLLAELLRRALDWAARHPELTSLAAEAPKVLKTLAPQTEDARVVLELDDKVMQGLALPLLARQREAAGRVESQNNMKQLGIAMHVYHDVHKGFPAAASYDAKGKALLSWRVHILPFVEQVHLYQQFRLDEPWDSPHNKKLIERMPAVFRSPDRKTEAGKTCYLVPTGPKTIFSGKKGLPIQKITDGTSNTILLVEADESAAVYWTQPEDLNADAKDLLDKLLRAGRQGFNAAFADGSVRFISRQTTLEQLRALISPAGGEVAVVP